MDCAPIAAVGSGVDSFTESDAEGIKMAAEKFVTGADDALHGELAKKHPLAAAFAPIGDITRAHKVMDFTSTCLFLIGSIFYMILSIMDYKWGVGELRSLPTWVYMADDDSTLYTYIGENDNHNYADDFIPNLQMNGAPVSYYQICYICGGLCFAISGLLDIISDWSLWPIFRLLAGGFAVASGIYISGNDYRISNIFNLISVHCYLVDSMTLFRHPHCCAVYPTEDGSKWTKKYLLFGDFTYFLGSAIDIPLAYLWVFFWAADWNITLCVFSIIGSALWLVCSLVYIKAFFKSDYYPNPISPPPRRVTRIVVDVVRRQTLDGRDAAPGRAIRRTTVGGLDLPPALSVAVQQPLSQSI